MNFDSPFNESIIIYIGLATIFVGIIIFAILFYQAAIRPQRKKKPDVKKPPGFINKIGKVFAIIFKAFHGPSSNDDEEKTPPGCLNLLFKIIFIVLLIGWGMAIIFFGAFIQSLTSFTEEELAAEVFCEEVDQNTHSMKMILIEKHGTSANRPQQFLLTGDRWFVRGDIIIWKNGVNFLGLNTMYKLTRIGGYFTDAKNETELKPSQYSLVPEEETPNWDWLYKNGYSLPLIKTTHSNSVSDYPEIGKVVRIYVTPLGLSTGSEQEKN